MSNSNAPPSLARELDAELASIPDLSDRLRRLTARLPGRVAFSTSLGMEDQALLHAIVAADPQGRIDVFTLDTGRHFPETLDLIATSQAHFGRAIAVFAPDHAASEELVARDGVLGFRLSLEARQACCFVRKVAPLRRALVGAQVWITGLRRGQSDGRTTVPFANWDEAHRLIKVNPLADWDLPTLETYVAAHAVPVSPLHARGFPSIGCQPCTRAIAPGEDIRAGRWWWEREDGKECGLHKSPRFAARARPAAVEVTS